MEVVLGREGCDWPWTWLAVSGFVRGSLDTRLVVFDIIKTSTVVFDMRFARGSWILGSWYLLSWVFIYRSRCAICARELERLAHGIRYCLEFIGRFFFSGISFICLRVCSSGSIFPLISSHLVDSLICSSGSSLLALYLLFPCLPQWEQISFSYSLNSSASVGAHFVCLLLNPLLFSLILCSVLPSPYIHLPFSFFFVPPLP